MKKQLLFLILTCASFTTYAQKLHASYEYIPSAVATFKEDVYYENGSKIAVRDSVPLKTTIGEIETPDGEIASNFSMILNTGASYRRIVMQQANVDALQETRSLQGVNYIVNDNFPKLSWNTDYRDIDTLGKFICHKATTTYRGTKLTAYYTNDIPVPVGPYKFGGLPGLIVMLYNESASPNYWMLKEVSYPYAGDVPVRKSYINSLPVLSLQEFVQKDEAVIQEQMRIMESKMPAMEGVTVERKRVRGTVEQVYEWEKSNKEN